MKTSHVCALLLSAFLFAFAAVSFASASAPSPAKDFENSPAWAKLDLRAREAWRQGVKSGESGAALEGFIKPPRQATADDKALLAQAGFAARTTAGSILTGSVSAKNVPAVASLDFVQAMELAVPLSTKQRK